jgi:hypothetical protein
LCHKTRFIDFLPLPGGKKGRTKGLQGGKFRGKEVAGWQKGLRAAKCGKKFIENTTNMAERLTFFCVFGIIFLYVSRNYGKERVSCPKVSF